MTTRTYSDEEPEDLDFEWEDYNEFERVCEAEDVFVSLKLYLRDTFSGDCVMDRLDRETFMRMYRFDDFVKDRESCWGNDCDCTGSFLHRDPVVLAWEKDHCGDLRSVYHLFFKGRLPWSHFVYDAWRSSRRNCGGVCRVE